MNNNIVEIYTDGACSGNPGPGGWCAILIYNGHEKIISGSEPNTTNNRMELIAPINALKALNRNCKVKIYSDSAYVVNAIEKGWLENWKLINFKKIKNVDLWKELIPLIEIHDVTFIKVKGHSTNVNNNRCDEIAQKMSIEAKTKG